MVGVVVEVVVVVVEADSSGGSLSGTVATGSIVVLGMNSAAGSSTGVSGSGVRSLVADASGSNRSVSGPSGRAAGRAPNRLRQSASDLADVLTHSDRHAVPVRNERTSYSGVVPNTGSPGWSTYLNGYVMASESTA